MQEKNTVFVSFSGGRTSAYMCAMLLERFGHKHDFIFVFANTGKEHPETIKFVKKCDEYFGLNLVLLEAVVHDGLIGCTHKIVTYETLSMDGSPFERVIEKYGIPNADFPHCNRELKINPINSYKRSLGFKTKHPIAIGIRADEIDRMSMDAMEKYGAFYPLISMRPTKKAEIVFWWRDMPFDLGIPEHLGNCVTCWKKSLRKLKTIAKNTPEEFSFFERMEKTHADTGAGDKSRVFFRRHKSAKDIIASSKIPFVESVDYKPELQLEMFDVDEDDIEFGCGSSCEAA